MENIKQDVSSENPTSETTVAQTPPTKSNPPKKSGKKAEISTFWMIFTKARKDFSVQLTKSFEVKYLCIEKHMSSRFDDKALFWLEFDSQVEKLTDSRKFEKECKALYADMTVKAKETKSVDFADKLDIAECIAEHIVFLGSATINKVLKNGIKNTIGNDYMLYTKKFSVHRSDKNKDESKTI